MFCKNVGSFYVIFDKLSTFVLLSLRRNQGVHKLLGILLWPLLPLLSFWSQTKKHIYSCIIYFSIIIRKPINKNNYLLHMHSAYLWHICSNDNKISTIPSYLGNRDNSDTNTLLRSNIRHSEKNAWKERWSISCI